MELALNDPKDFAASTTVEVRFADIDLMGHLNNALYFTFFEQARFAYFRHLKGFTFSPAARLSFILAEISCQFLSPAQMGDLLTIWTSITSVGTKSFSMEYLITRGEESIARGKSVQVMYDYTAGKTIPIPPEIMKQVETLEKRSLTRKSS